MLWSDVRNRNDITLYLIRKLDASKESTVVNDGIRWVVKLAYDGDDGTRHLLAEGGGMYGFHIGRDNDAFPNYGTWTSVSELLSGVAEKFDYEFLSAD